MNPKKKDLCNSRTAVFFLTLLLSGLLLALFPARQTQAQTAQTAAAARVRETAEVNGVSIAYEVAGEGYPVILIHGNGGSRKDLYTEMDQLVEAGYKVYNMDSRGQGENAPVETYHYEDMAEDVYQLIQYWGLKKPVLYGWSDGGIIGLLLEIRHPGTLGALAGSGVNTTPDGLTDYFLQSIAFIVFFTPTSLTEMILKEPDIKEEELASIEIPVLLTAGSDDIIKEEHTRMIAETIPHAKLVILQGEDHGSYIQNSEIMGDLLIRFLGSLQLEEQPGQ